LLFERIPELIEKAEEAPESLIASAVADAPAVSRGPRPSVSIVNRRREIPTETLDHDQTRIVLSP
jgi:hypothetical protein